MRELASTYLAGPTGDTAAARTRPSSTWVTVLAIENLATRWVLDQPAITRDQLLDEIVALVGGYLLS